jgi:hypothetical protein
MVILSMTFDNYLLKVDHPWDSPLIMQALGVVGDFLASPNDGTTLYGKSIIWNSIIFRVFCIMHPCGYPKKD